MSQEEPGVPAPLRRGGPLSVAELGAAAVAELPDHVIESLNVLIPKNMAGASSRVRMNDLVKAWLDQAIGEGASREEFDAAVDRREEVLEPFLQSIFNGQGLIALRSAFDAGGWDVDLGEDSDELVFTPRRSAISVPSDAGQRPIDAAQLQKDLAEAVPDLVIESCNEVLSSRFKTGTLTIEPQDLLDELWRPDSGRREDAERQGLFDFDRIVGFSLGLKNRYEAMGWDVTIGGTDDMPNWTFKPRA